MKEKFNAFVIWSTTSTKAQWLMILLQTACGGSGVVYSMNNEYKDLSQYMFLASLALLIAWIFSILIFNRKYGLIFFFLKHETGVLLDKNTNFRNVSLRADSISVLLNGIINENNDRVGTLLSVSENIGRGFVKIYNDFLSTKKQNAPRDMLIQILKYDSSSGMGRFDIVEESLKPNVYFKISIKNQFLGSADQDAYAFFQGYVKGLIEATFGKPFDVQLTEIESALPCNIIITANEVV